MEYNYHNQIKVINQNIDNVKAFKKPNNKIID